MSSYYLNDRSTDYNNYRDVDYSSFVNYYDYNNSDRKYYGERNYNHSTNNDNYRSDYLLELFRNDRRSHIKGYNSRTNGYSATNEYKPLTKSKTDSVNDKCEKPSNKQLQLDEITALKSIFEEPVLTVDEKRMRGRFIIEPKLISSPFFIVYYCIEMGKMSAKHEFTVEHLPPIELFFEFSDSYPSDSHPMFLIACKWLDIYYLGNICEHLEKLWIESKSEVLYKWFSFLQNDVLNWLKITQELDISRIINTKPFWRDVTDSGNKFSIVKCLTNCDRNYIEFIPKFKCGDIGYDQRALFDLIGFELINHLRLFDETRRKEIFDTTYYLCNICFSQHSGKDCVSFTCEHIHCRNCISGYFESLVKDGAVNSLKCPAIKCETQAPLNLIRELLSEDLYKRFDNLKMASFVATIDDAHYCPRKLCGSVVMAEKDSSLAHCQACSFAFCKHCKYSYHGIDPCQLFRDDKQRKIILDKYRHANDNIKSQIEKLYEKKQLVAALDEYESEKWIDSMSKRCPHCKASIEKSDGCNKMLCWRCNTYFCWLCLQHLNINSPYSHYNDPQSKCHQLLF